MSLYFSGGFNVKPKTIEKYGAFNISLVSDLPLFIPSKRGMGMWKTLRVSHIPTPSARRRLRTNFKRGATLTIYLVQNPGQLRASPSIKNSQREDSWKESPNGRTHIR